MSTLIKANINKVLKYILMFFAVLIGTYLFTLVIKLIFNLGAYFGTFMRILYTILCNLL